VDNEEAYESVLRFVERFQPALISRVKLYSRSNPIFDEFGVTAELEKALRPKVWLKSGGHIVINQTEALVAIDVNTASSWASPTAWKTPSSNQYRRHREIVRQIRLRDLGGIIVIDFIDMDERKNRQKVMQTLEDASRRRAPTRFFSSTISAWWPSPASGQAEPGAHAVHAVPVLRGCRLRESRRRCGRDLEKPEDRRCARRHRRHAARVTGSRKLLKSNQNTYCKSWRKCLAAP